MKTITIELTENEYKDLKKEAEDWKQPLEDYLVVAGRLYKKVLIKKEDLQTKNYQLQEEIVARNNCIDKYEDILQKYYEYAGDLPKDR